MTNADFKRLEKKIDVLIVEQKEQRAALNVLLQLLVEEVGEDDELPALTLDGEPAGGERDADTPL